MNSLSNTANKVAQITFLFWVMKILATTLGETAGDLLSMTLNIGYLYSLVITMLFFVVVLIGQLRSKIFYAPLYWLAIVGTTTVGTEVSDFMDRSLGLGYAAGATVLFTGLIGTLLLWYRKEGELEIYPIRKTSVEVFYWTAILFSNSLGTAFGDFLSDNLGLSYLAAAVITAVIILVVVLLHYFSHLNHILLFWIAFIFTRPFGATFGDLLTKPIAKGGLDLGTIPASLVTAVLLMFFVWLAHRSERNKAGRVVRMDSKGG